MDERYKKDSRGHSRFAFGIITLMHDNPLLPHLIDAQRLLKDAGLKSGDKVLEVGCGPGFFTLPAAEIVGDKGILYAVDVHPRAIEKVRKKIEEKGISNVRPLLRNAADTGLTDGSVDAVFMFGLPYIVGGQEKVLNEMRRILKPGGVLSYKKTRGSEKTLIEDMEKVGMICSGKKGRILLFKKTGH
ncbi:MAG: class I SAM-dependent methyltransferase [Deltaproteobacteria bacterium]|nr:class I SAM-dependent methyltransferase [Deltaproteobacteria bacterium]